MLVIDYSPQDFLGLYLKHQRLPDGRNRNPRGGRAVDVCGLLALEFGYRSQHQDGLMLDFFERQRAEEKIQATRNQLLAFGQGFSNAYCMGQHSQLYQQNLIAAMAGGVETEYLHGHAIGQFLLTVKW